MKICEIIGLAGIAICLSFAVYHASAESFDHLPGDTCDTALLIDNLPFQAEGHTGYFNDDYDEICPLTGSTAGDVVYEFTPQDNITVDIILCTGSTDYDSKIYVYQGECTGINLVACNDDHCRTDGFSWTYVSRLQHLDLIGGDVYYVIIDGNRWHEGNYFLDIYESYGTPVPGDEYV